MAARGMAAPRPGSAEPWTVGHLGRTARGRPPSPLIGAGYVWAVQWIALGSALLQQWACG